MPSLFLSQTAKEGMSPWIQSRQKMTIRSNFSDNVKHFINRHPDGR
jgi:hypothetical protein